MKLPSLFKTPGYRSFNFQPRYYDPEKEAFRERLEKAAGDRTEAAKEQIRHHFRVRRERRMRATGKMSMLRIILIIVLLSVIIFRILL